MIPQYTPITVSSFLLSGAFMKALALGASA